MKFLLMLFIFGVIPPDTVFAGEPVKTGSATVIDDLGKKSETTNDATSVTKESQAKKDETQKKVNPSPADGVTKVADEPQEGEGFIVEERGVGGRDGKKVKKLVDDPGKGEVVPRFLVQVWSGLTGGENIDTKSGVPLGVTLLYRPWKGLWAGITGDLGYMSGNAIEHLVYYDLALESRYYFMLHPEANRFVMGYFLLEAGYLGAQGAMANNNFTTGGVFGALGFGAGRSLDTKTYVGFQVKYMIPVWGSFCYDPDSECKMASDYNFDANFWQISITLSRRF